MLCHDIKNCLYLHEQKFDHLVSKMLLEYLEIAKDLFVIISSTCKEWELG
jgi:hypothetical protein